MQINIYKDKMLGARLFGAPVLYSVQPIPCEDVPQGWYCYDLRGTARHPDEPHALVDKAEENHTGTILSYLPLKNGRSQYRLVKDMFQMAGTDPTLAEFCAAENIRCPETPLRHMLCPASPEEAGLFYAQTPEKDEELGTIGHVRIDFGYKGKEFWHTWWPRGPEELNTQEFRDELDKVVNDLRRGVLKDLSSMRRYCYGSAGKIEGGSCCQNYGFTLETERYLYRLRCNPTEGDYQAYLSCFDKQAQRMGLTETGKQALRDTAVEKRMQEMLIDLYAELVPYEVQQEIRARIDAEYAAAQAEAEAARKYTAFCVRENGTQSFFQLDRSESILEVAKFLRRYLREDQGQGTAAPRTSAFARMEPVTAERYDQMLALRMESPGKVTGVFDLDFDRQEVSTVDAADGWKTWSMQDVSAAIFHAYRKSCLRPEQYMSRFLERLEGRELTSPGHLSARDISFAEEITEIDSLLNFYMTADFNVDAAFGTHVCTSENDDTLNVYANYDMAAGQVCDELEVDLHRADGREESVEYRLNAVEKATLLWKMDAYCQEQTGQTLADYSTQRMAEDIAPQAPQM